MRIDPSVATGGSAAGIKILPLEACTNGTCRAPMAVAGAASPLSRLPLQMKVRDDGHGNTDVFFTEQAADAIGALRVDPNGKMLAERHFSAPASSRSASRSTPTATSGTARGRRTDWAA